MASVALARSRATPRPSWAGGDISRSLKSGGNQNMRARAEREAINSPIQGTAADILKTGHDPHAFGAAEKRGWQRKMLLQVHDELVLECPKNELLPPPKWFRT